MARKRAEAPDDDGGGNKDDDDDDECDPYNVRLGSWFIVFQILVLTLTP